MKQPILKITDLSYSYDNHEKILKDVNLDIFEREKIAVLGANGSGKSTFFLNINGVLIHETGDIYYRDTKIDKKNRNELRKRVGIVFQDADNQIIASTVLAEVSFGPMNLKLSKEKVKEQVYEALDYMNLIGFEERPPHYLSGGEKKRVSIADIIAMKPEVIIFDEPTASLDPLNQQMLEEVLKKLEKEGKTVLISTHDVDFAYRWAERILVFSKGEIIADAPPDEIFQNDEIIKAANLKRPVLLDIYEMLVNKKFLKAENSYPKTIDELYGLLSKSN
ncbi:cobalt/nickel transport system ATP-binding protein [Mobilisporobacter senegalensis]|uniref:ABC transporter ATP-binding protein n=1 Tax=Mobilisporobacter senegalensis TaxID=1329262 RepID=A0A3N1XNT3_9FIRM|nr:energy-coupling factor ABC transporter ATP-binding protein [Mobilisporobacter senegalensis]ROR28325.1 cobalt/nickel transport system ATP-binding protein [Mobilisporobacter senegalensis]